MSPSSHFRPRIRALVLISTCITITAINSVLASGQQAEARWGNAVQERSSIDLFKAAIIPERTPITINSVSDKDVCDRFSPAVLSPQVNPTTVTSISHDETAVLGCSLPQFGGPTNLAVGNQPRSMASGDFNHDGRIDMAVANYGTGQGNNNGSISILLNNGSAFSTTSFTAGINPRSIVTADFNNDQNLDLAVLNYVNGNCARKENEMGDVSTSISNGKVGPEVIDECKKLSSYWRFNP